MKNKEVLTMLPIEQWQVARIIHFRYSNLDRPCNATIVYFLPYEVCVKKHNINIIDDCIMLTLKNCFGEISNGKRNVMFDIEKSNMQKIYDGGRPKIRLVMRMIPDISEEQLFQSVGKTFFAYDYNLNIQLNYWGEINDYQKEMFVTTSYPLAEEELVAWGSGNIETL